jgi:hypothetical protein
MVASEASHGFRQNGIPPKRDADGRPGGVGLYHQKGTLVKNQMCLIKLPRRPSGNRLETVILELTKWQSIEIINNFKSKMVEAAGIEPASGNLPTEHLHTYSVF